MDVARRQAPAPVRGRGSGTSAGSASRGGGGGGGGGEGSEGSPDAVTWRLVGANNHELGRSPHVHGSLTACCAAVEQLQGHIEQAAPLVVMSSGTGAWTWQLALEEQCVAVAVRTFRRQRECRHSLQLFLSATAEAQVASRVTYTRRLRGLRLPGAADVPGLAVRGGGLL
ncbi:hypothetical protein [Streptomyces sp. NPDC056492]|uniref:hypothetical protein n=1 Tax=Streptomyces sp. NPDC056492 TaxID=3345838 RepID=UPI00367A0670